MWRIALSACIALLACLLVAVKQPEKQAPFIKVLGTAQDAGYPQANCQRDCCANLLANHQMGNAVSCLGIVDPESGEFWMLDATPDFGKQLVDLQNAAGQPGVLPAGILLTHAHIGHYTGLMYLGREAVGAKGVKVYVMPKMKAFLESNGPWSQLVALGNIQLVELEGNKAAQLNGRIAVTPIPVPHRDEFSETVGFRVQHGARSALFIPDIDKWNRWDRDVLEEIRQVDYAFLDGTFYANEEIPGRDMSEIPHPFMEESMALFDALDAEQREKVHFIHFNHTNPVLKWSSAEFKAVRERGYHVALTGEQHAL